MNRQAANYVESVGDNKHYDWQTPKHNRWMLAITVSLLIFVFWIFIKQNTIHREVMSISLVDVDTTSSPLLSCNVSVNYDYSGDFIHSSDGKIYNTKNFVTVDASIVMSENGTNHHYTMVPDNYTMHHDYGKRPEQVLVTKKLECDFSLQTVYRPVIDHKVYNITKAYTENNPFSKQFIEPNALVDVNAYLDGDIIRTHAKWDVFNKSLLNPRKNSIIIRTQTYNQSTGETISKDSVVMMSYEEYKNWLLVTNKKKNTSVPNQILNEEKIVEPFYEVQVRNPNNVVKEKLMLYSGHNQLLLANRNVSCVYINQGGLQLPKAQKQEFTLGYQSPMLFDEISIEPDKRTESKLIYTSQEKLQQINEEGLMIVARSVANANVQETLNFLYATLIGLIFSFFVEFNKRLYNARRQRIYASGEEYIPFISVAKSIALSIKGRLFQLKSYLLKH